MAPYDGGLYEVESLVQNPEQQSLVGEGRKDRGQEQCSGNQDGRPAGARSEQLPCNDAPVGWSPGKGRFLYPVVVIAGVLLLIILAAV